MCQMFTTNGRLQYDTGSLIFLDIGLWCTLNFMTVQVEISCTTFLHLGLNVLTDEYFEQSYSKLLEWAEWWPKDMSMS